MLKKILVILYLVVVVVMAAATFAEHLYLSLDCLLQVLLHTLYMKLQYPILHMKLQG